MNKIVLTMLMITVFKQSVSSFNINVEKESIKFLLSPLQQELNKVPVNIPLTKEDGSHSATDEEPWKGPVPSEKASSFFGYDFIISSGPDQGLVVGAPKTLDFSDRLAQGNATDSSTTGDISYCAIGDIFNEPFTSNCQSIVPNVAAKGDAFGVTVEDSPDGKLTACSPAKTQTCTFSVHSPGFCYNKEQSSSDWIPDPYTTNTECPSYSLDLIFTLDGSGSVKEDDFEIVKRWVKEIVSNFDISDGSVRVGVVEYSGYYPTRELDDQPYIQTKIPLGKYSDQTKFALAVNKIKGSGFTTYTAHALNKTASDFMDSDRFDSVPKVLILLTDGISSDHDLLDSSASYIRSLGITTFAVGVGKAQEGELKTIATGTDTLKNVFNVKDFDQLEMIVNQLKKAIITVVLEGSKSSSTAALKLEYAETGFSMSSSKKLNSRTGQPRGGLYLGAVGAYDWSGTIVKYDSSDDQVPDIPDFEQVQDVLNDRTKESYLGYAITSGYFDGRANINNEYVAIGAPRYSLKGAVVIYRPQEESAEFTQARTIYPNNQNSQLGSYFGGALLALDLNRDGRDDLLVAAPLYSRRNSYDDGRVFVYIAPQGGQSHSIWANPNNPPTNLFKTLSPGTASQGGRFGTAMASAGDLNSDGYNDVIIGAPYANDNRGAVFVFHGSSDGIDTEYKQVIRASELPNTYLRYFGLSLQGGQDLDGNGYPDVAVGAPKSDTVVIFRSRPVVNFQPTLDFNLNSVNVFDCLTTPDRDCLVLTACLTVTGSRIEPFISVDYGLDLDSGVSGIANKRVEFRERSGVSSIINGTRNLTNSVRNCWNATVFVKQSIPDNVAQIEAVLTYKLSESHLRRSLSSVRDPTISNQVQATSQISRDCGDDNVCDYNLGLDAQLRLPPARLNGRDITNNGQTLIISQETAFSPIIMKVNLTNTGESAYRVSVVVNYTAQLSWNNLGRYQSSNKPAGFPCVDDAQSDVNGDTWRVKVLHYRLDQNRINIMPEDSWCYFEFNLSSNSLSANGALPEIRVAVSTGTGNDVNIREDTDRDNNQVVKTAPVRYRADATAQERSPDIPLPFNFTDETVTITSVNQIGMNISNLQMTYEIDGRGHSNIPKSTIRFSFPYRLPNTTEADMMHLLYLYRYSCESTEGEAECICDESVVNPYNLLERFPNENDTGLSNITITPNPNKITQSVLYDCSENGNEAPGTCATLQCDVMGLASTDNIIFRVNFRFWSHSFNLMNTSLATLRTGFRFSTENSPLLINQRGENVTVATASTNVVARLFVPPEVIISSNDIWIYIVAAIGGLLLLIIIIIVLWKTGFFKSKYAEKKEQLEWTEANASGGSNGDAASTADIVGS